MLSGVVINNKRRMFNNCLIRLYSLVVIKYAFAANWLQSKTHDCSVGKYFWTAFPSHCKMNCFKLTYHIHWQLGGLRIMTKIFSLKMVHLQTNQKLLVIKPLCHQSVESTLILLINRKWTVEFYKIIYCDENRFMHSNFNMPTGKHRRFEMT